MRHIRHRALLPLTFHFNRLFYIKKSAGSEVDKKSFRNLISEKKSKSPNINVDNAMLREGMYITVRLKLHSFLAPFPYT